METKTSTEAETLLHSVLSCEKNGIPISKIEDEYRVLIGTPIPYRQLGYSSLTEYIKSVPNTAVIRMSPDGVAMVEAVPNLHTGHVSQMVANQRTASKTKPVVRPSRHPAPRTGPSVRFADYQSLLDNQRASSPSQAASLAPMHMPPRRTYRGTARGLPQLKQLGVKAGAPRDETAPRWQQHANGVPAATANEGAGFGTAAPCHPPWRSPLRLPQGPDAPVPPSATPPPPPHARTPPAFSSPAPPATSVVLPSVPAVPKTYRQRVEEYGHSRGLEVVFKATHSQSKKSPGVWFATLKIGNQTYHTYPAEKGSPEEASEAAAREAAHFLHLDSNSSTDSEERLPKTDVSTPSKVQVFVDRVVKLLAAKADVRGLWSTVVQELYQEQHKEDVPDNWLEIVTPVVTVHYPIAGDWRCVLYGPSASSQEPSNRTQPWPQPQAKPQQPQPQSEPSPASGAHCETLLLPEGPHWDVFVTYASSTAEVYFRLVDSSEEYERLSDEMDGFYAVHTMPVVHPEEGSLYATSCEGSWLRVRALGVQGRQVECLFVDHGDIDSVPVEKLQELDPRFQSLSFQAVHCQLDELVDFAEDDQASRLLNELVVGKCLIAEVNCREPQLTVTLYDTTTTEDVNLNVLMLKRLETPLLPGPDGIARVVLSHVDSAGNLYVQMQGARLHYVARYMEAVGNHIAQNNIKPASSLCKTKLYACRVDSGNFARVLLLDTTPTKKMVLAKFVDSGVESLVGASDLYDLDVFREKISSFPHQALICRLADVTSGPWTDKATRLLREMVPSNLVLLLKVVTPAKDGSPPLVSMFKRIEPNNELVSVNLSLSVSLDLARQEERKPKRDRVGLTRRSSVPDKKPEQPATNGIGGGGFPSVPAAGPRGDGPPPSSPCLASEEPPPQPDALAELQAEGLEGVGQPLAAPLLPEVGAYLDVNVTEAANPLNFTCQQWLQGAQLEALMSDMQSFYAAEGSSAFPEGLPEALLHRGGYYAGRHATDHCWYRVLVQQVQGPLMASVYFVDYGDYGLMQPSELQPLWQRFRNLPAQAIRASLADVSPKCGDWDPVDCIEFRKRVKDKQFVAKIVAKEPDSGTGVEGAQRLVVRLIDTSTSVDIYIDQELEQKGIVHIGPPPLPSAND